MVSALSVLRNLCLFQCDKDTVAFLYKTEIEFRTVLGFSRETEPIGCVYM